VEEDLVQGSMFKIMFGNCLENRKDKDNKDKKNMSPCLFYLKKDKISFKNYSRDIFIFYIFVLFFIQTHICYFYIYFFYLKILTNHILKQFLLNLNMHSLLRRYHSLKHG
jgi:hypothetical protein